MIPEGNPAAQQYMSRPQDLEIIEIVESICEGHYDYYDYYYYYYYYFHYYRQRSGMPTTGARLSADQLTRSSCNQ